MEVLVVGLAHVCGEGFETGHARGAPAALAADYYVAVGAVTAYRYGLYDTELADRVGQLAQRLLVERGAGLRGVGYDLPDGYLGHVAHGRNLGGDVLGAEDCIQSTS